MRRVSLVVIGALGLGCSLIVDADGLSTTPRAQTPNTAIDAGSVTDGGASTPDGGGDPGKDGGGGDGAMIAFAGVTARGVYADTCPCTLTAPPVAGPNPLMVFAVSINAQGEDAPDTVMYNGTNLGPPDESIRVPYTRIAVWHLTNPPSAGDFTIGWTPNQTENAVMMAAVYTNVDQANPYRSPPVQATGPEPPALLPTPSNPQPTDRIVSFFGINDTSPSRGLTAARVGALQTFRAQQGNDSEESQLALSDGPIDPAQNPHQWSYMSGSPWTAIGLLLARAP